MRIGLFIDDRGTTLDEYLAAARSAVDAGIQELWLGDRLAWDPLTLLAITGREIPGIRLGTAVLRTYPRHPIALADQALSVQAATGNRLVLGVGPSHEAIISGQYGYSFDKPARHVREYLEALIPLLRGENVAYQGSTLSATGQVAVPGASAPPVLISALGPRMLRIAGELTDGTITTWAGPKTLSSLIVPTITASGRSPEVIANLCVAVTPDPDSAREWLNSMYGAAMSLPSYRAIFDREGVTSVGDTAIVGPESVVVAEIQRLFDAGATGLLAVAIGSAEEQERTVSLLGSLTS
ncbi:TIGR03564 family F420-dependent LLM class oxidoreductase [Actinocrispum sp. NPDC049592]|uniref:TIGR03564 family F420-dependent LLM class oxidoreductase n=1 Tax=Actinocrispum sp. NPDC049592 TaxID=3154835 RepID=UPI00341A35C8